MSCDSLPNFTQIVGLKVQNCYWKTKKIKLYVPGIFLNVVRSYFFSKSSWMNLFTSGSLFKRHPAQDSTLQEWIDMSPSPSAWNIKLNKLSDWKLVNWQCSPIVINSIYSDYSKRQIWVGDSSKFCGTKKTSTLRWFDKSYFAEV